MMDQKKNNNKTVYNNERVVYPTFELPLFSVNRFAAIIKGGTDMVPF